MNQSNVCHAIGCDRRRPAQFIMCPLHWSLVPRELQRELRNIYRPNRARADHARQFLTVSEQAIVAVAVAEGQMTDEQATDRLTAMNQYSARLAEKMV